MSKLKVKDRLKGKQLRAKSSMLDGLNNDSLDSMTVDFMSKQSESTLAKVGDEKTVKRFRVPKYR